MTNNKITGIFRKIDENKMSIKPSFYRTLTEDLPSSELAHIMVLNTGIVNQGSIFNFSVE